MGADALQRARDALGRANPESALQLLEGSDDLEAAMLRGRCFEVLGRFDEAVAEYDAAALHDEATAAPLRRKGTALREMGRVEAAVTAFEDALRRDSADAETVQELFFTWMELGNEREARDVLERARRHLPNDPELFRAEGLALTRLGRHPESVSALQQVVLLRPEDGQAHLDLASARFRAGDYADAFEDYEHALQRLDDEDRRRPILMCQAMCRLEQGRPSEAVQVLRRVVQNDPADLRARMHLGSALEAAAEYEEAIRCYDEIATQAEDDPTGVTLGGQALYAKAKTCFMHLDDHTSGLDAIDTLVALAGKTGIAAGRRLARELQQAGRPEAARVVSEECDAVESIL